MQCMGDKFGGCFRRHISGEFSVVLFIPYFSSALSAEFGLSTSAVYSPRIKVSLESSHAISKFGNVIRNNQNKLGKCALKINLKSTVNQRVSRGRLYKTINRLFNHCL